MTSTDFRDLDLHPVAQPGSLRDAVPVIDVGTLNGKADEASQAHADIAAACREWGFFQVVNHTISSELIADLWRQTRAFFALGAAERTALTRTRDNPWGYYNRELTKNQRDKKQVFDFTTEGADPIYRATNRWPASLDGFRETMLAWLDACTTLSLQLLDAFCVGLDLPPDHLRWAFDSGHTGFVRLNHYPVEDPTGAGRRSDPRNADMGVHHHTDAGALTVLLQDDIGGLQVHRDGWWHNVEPLAGALVINTGDMMRVWSNDHYQAAMHRVVAMTDHDRYSIPFFFNPSANARVCPLRSVPGGGTQPRYRPILWSDYRGKRTDGDYADYGAEVQIADYRISVD